MGFTGGHKGTPLRESLPQNQTKKTFPVKDEKGHDSWYHLVSLNQPHNPILTTVILQEQVEPHYVR